LLLSLLYIYCPIVTNSNTFSLNLEQCVAEELDLEGLDSEGLDSEELEGEGDILNTFTVDGKLEGDSKTGATTGKIYFNIYL